MSITERDAQEIRSLFRPDSSMSVWVKSSVPGQGLLNAELHLSEQPELVEFLVGVDPERPPPLPPKLAEPLRSLGAWLPEDRLPQPVQLKSPSFSLRRKVKQADDLALNPSVELQFDLEPPERVRCRSFHSAALLRERPILWLTDFLTGTVYPQWLPDSLKLPVYELVNGDRSIGSLSREMGRALVERSILMSQRLMQEQLEVRRSKLRSTGVQLAQEGFAILRQAIFPPFFEVIRDYVRCLEAEGGLAKGDIHCHRRLVAKDDPGLGVLHAPLATVLEEALGMALRPTFTYLLLYQNEASLPRHVDRAQCRWNISLAIDATDPGGSPFIWPLQVEVGGASRKIDLAPGDAAVYSGTQLAHWRDPLPPGHRATICTFHFVEPSFNDAMD